uniref:Uncharacterized protein n=1 Tax=Anguilla anguilla TaxID=7936 RepID=A0A0E9WKB6_ANGAN
MFYKNSIKCASRVCASPKLYTKRQFDNVECRTMRFKHNLVAKI